MNKCGIYYTHNCIDSKIFTICQQQINNSFDSEVVSVSLEPINFGKNIVLDLKPSVITMFTQILTALEHCSCDYVFFLEHDVLYHKSHFDFIPPRNDVYYYNTNVWRWKYPDNFFITYDGLISLSGICAYRELLLNHYIQRLKKITDMGWEDGRDPNWARKIGYEPGKPRRRGGFMDEETAEWKSEYPNIDIRHSKCLTPSKVTLKSFRHLPTNWKETTFENIKGWNDFDIWSLKA